MPSELAVVQLSNPKLACWLRHRLLAVRTGTNSSNTRLPGARPPRTPTINIQHRTVRSRL